MTSSRPSGGDTGPGRRSGPCARPGPRSRPLTVLTIDGHSGPIDRTAIPLEDRAADAAELARIEVRQGRGDGELAVLRVHLDRSPDGRRRSRLVGELETGLAGFVQPLHRPDRPGTEAVAQVQLDQCHPFISVLGREAESDFGRLVGQGRCRITVRVGRLADGDAEIAGERVGGQEARDDRLAPRASGQPKTPGRSPTDLIILAVDRLPRRHREEPPVLRGFG